MSLICSYQPRPPQTDLYDDGMRRDGRGFDHRTLRQRGDLLERKGRMVQMIEHAAEPQNGGTP
jgi:hypothetical protein